MSIRREAKARAAKEGRCMGIWGHLWRADKPLLVAPLDKAPRMFYRLLRVITPK